MLITALAKEKSLVSVARSINISASAISQRLSAMEARLQIKIAERIGRSGIRLTSEGEFLASQGASIIDDLRQLDNILAQQKGTISGHITVMAPLGFGRIHIAPLLSDFQTVYPEISIALRLSDAIGKLPLDSWDIIIQVSPPRDSSLKMLKLAENRRYLCASPAYLEKNEFPKSPVDLLQHDCIAIQEDDVDFASWRLEGKNRKSQQVRIDAKFITNDGEVALDWALAGKGILMRSEWSVSNDLKAGRLVRVLDDWTTNQAPIFALTSGPRGRTQRVASLLEFLKEKLQQPDWQI